MAEDSTMLLNKPGSGPVQSTIFNTSIRGWIALILAVVLGLAFLMTVLAPFFGVKMPEGISGSVVALFAAGFTAAVNHYFDQKLKEGQKQ